MNVHTCQLETVFKCTRFNRFQVGPEMSDFYKFPSDANAAAPVIIPRVTK